MGKHKSLDRVLAIDVVEYHMASILADGFRGTLQAISPRDLALILNPCVWDCEDKRQATLGPIWLPRWMAENDARYRHVATYCVVMDPDGLVLTYARGKDGGEDRLKGLRSLGVGGHVDWRPDVDKFAGNMLSLVTSSAIGEVYEEIGLGVQANGFKEEYFSSKMHLLGVIADDAGPVESVHLGVVFVVEYDGKTPLRREPGHVEDIKFATWEEASEMNLERWSRIIVDRATYRIPDYPPQETAR